MRLFSVVLALAVTASTQAMAFEPSHHRHTKQMPTSLAWVTAQS